MKRRLPQYMWVVRHGQSAGNVALEAAEAASLDLIDLAFRDADVPLSALGEEQARALGVWFGRMSEAERPTVVLHSPFERARATAEIVVRTSGIPESELFIRSDERLREKEFGILDRLTRFGIQKKHPELSKQRGQVGKFYFRPPGGESWCDVILRLRSLIDTIALDHEGERVLIVGHQVVVSCMRYLVERLDERAILAIDKEVDVPNCSVTSYEHDEETDLLVGRLVNFVAPLEHAGAPITAAPDVSVAPGS